MGAAEAIPEDLVFVDLETTGARAEIDRITEVGIIRLRDGELIDEWSSLVNPECPIPPFIEAFTGISNEMVGAAPRFADIAATVRQKLQGAVFVAHNARFDYSFLRSEFLKTDMNFSARVLCTVKLSRRLFPEHARHNLDAVMERNGLSCDARHRALGDAKVIHDFWCKLRREVAEPRLAAAVNSALGEYKLPAHLPPGLSDDLPEGPGVYRFFGEGDALLFVGRSRSLRNSVCGHFVEASAPSRDRRLADQVRRVDWVLTPGELGAMLKEAEWIKSRKPLFNRRGKVNTRPHTLRAGTRGHAVAAIALDEVDFADLNQCYGVFHSDKDARKALGDIASAKQLCLKVLGLEDGAGSCLAHQVGKCKGVCAGKEPIVLHNMRLMLALSSLKLKAWPFPGRIAVRERELRRGLPESLMRTELHVVDHWSYLGTARSDEELAVLATQESRTTFDADTYRILARYFAQNSKLDWIDLRPSERPAA